MESPSDNDSSRRPSAGGMSVGERLGRFEILGPLGAGAMGEVYRARDVQLLREVAIKVLPTVFSRDADRQRRFEREARAAASLNHPNIIAVHDVGVHDGVGFIVTELLEGHTLRERMGGRPLPPRKAVEYAIQIASGLAAGHERGIVHRDIKPDNLFVTRDGRIKILDFGLAKIIDPGDSGDATATVTLDGVGPIVGTAAYMSPEQARGLRIDARSDIFSLGVVLYEMLAGYPPFRRSTTAETFAAILHDAPSELASAAPVSAALERIVRHCLEKTPEERFQSVRDLVFDLNALPDAALTADPKRPRTAAARGRILGALALLALSATAILGYLAGRRGTEPVGIAPAASYSVQRLSDLPGVEEFPSISPDRKYVAFTANIGGLRQIFVRLLAGGASVPITKDAVDHQFPRWSPDGNSLVYYSPARSNEPAGEIWRVPALGGSPQKVIDSIGGADVSSSGRLACFRRADGNIQLVSAALDGTDVRVLARFVADYHLHPRWSPDANWIAFQKGDGLRFDIFVVAGTGGEPRKLTDERNIIRGLTWLPDSSGIVFASSHGSTVPYLPPMALWQIRLDGTQPARQISSAEGWYEYPDIHGSGLLAAARMQMRLDIWQFPFDTDPAGNVRRAQQMTRQTGQVLTPSGSPDGSEIAFLSDTGGHGNIWVLSTVDGQLRQITFETDPAVTMGLPVWSPDGKTIAFVSSKGHKGFEFGIWLVNPQGTNLRNLAPKGLGMAWSLDSQWIYYSESAAGPLLRIRSSGGSPVRVRAEAARNVIGLHGSTLYYILERPLLDGRPELEILAATPEDGPSRSLARVPASRVPSWQVVNPALSPDGEWLAMPLTDGFTTNIWALSTKTGAWRQVTDFGERATFIARRVSWSADGRSILAAVGEGDADIVSLDGLIPRR